MLNKQKSRRRNSWKYAAIMPALAAFILAFQVKVVAQEKEPVAAGAVKADVLITHGPAQNKLVIKIDKDTKDSELEERKKTIKDEFNANVVFSNVKRNSSSEIVSIKVALDEKNSGYEVTGKQPIQPFTIIMTSKGKGTKDYAVDFGTHEDFHLATVYPSPHSNDTIIFSSKQYVARPANPQPFTFSAPAVMAYAAPQPIAAPGNAIALNFGNDDALVVINGVKYAKGQEITLPAGHQITGITALNDKEGKAKYGKEGKKGAIIITSAVAPRAVAAPNMPQNVAYGYSLPLEFQESHIMDNFPYEIMKDIDFGAGGFSSLSPEKQKQVAERIEAFVAERKNDERFQLHKRREELQIQKNDLRQMLETNRAVIEERKAEIEKVKAETGKQRAEESARRKELKRKAEEERKAKSDKEKN